MAFTTIELTPGLRGADRRSAREAAPPAAAVRKPYVDLLASAGFVDIGRRDATAEYRATATQWLTEYQRHRETVMQAAGEEFLADRLGWWAGSKHALDRGWLQRHVYWARRR